MSFPHISPEPSFVKIRSISPKSTFENNGSIESWELDLGDVDFGISLERAKEGNFNITNLTLEDIDSLRTPTDCQDIQGILACSSFLPISDKLTSCLKGIFQIDKNAMADCPLKS